MPGVATLIFGFDTLGTWTQGLGKDANYLGPYGPYCSSVCYIHLVSNFITRKPEHFDKEPRSRRFKLGSEIWHKTAQSSSSLPNFLRRVTWGLHLLFFAIFLNLSSPQERASSAPLYTMCLWVPQANLVTVRKYQLYCSNHHRRPECSSAGHG